MIAALFVETNGCYFGLPDVDPWDEARDARLFDQKLPQLPKAERAATPLEFRDLLLSIARTAQTRSIAA